MQQPFCLLIFLIQPYLFRATNSLLLTGAVAPVGSSVGALHQKLYIQSKRAPEDGRICRPKYVVLN